MYVYKTLRGQIIIQQQKKLRRAKPNQVPQQSVRS
jgi:hypothetical protein